MLCWADMVYYGTMLCVGLGWELVRCMVLQRNGNFRMTDHNTNALWYVIVDARVCNVISVEKSVLVLGVLLRPEPHSD